MIDALLFHIIPMPLVASLTQTMGSHQPTSPAGLSSSSRMEHYQKLWPVNIDIGNRMTYIAYVNSPTSWYSNIEYGCTSIVDRNTTRQYSYRTSYSMSLYVVGVDNDNDNDKVFYSTLILNNNTMSAITWLKLSNPIFYNLNFIIIKFWQIRWSKQYHWGGICAGDNSFCLNRRLPYHNWNNIIIWFMSCMNL